MLQMFSLMLLIVLSGYGLFVLLSAIELPLIVWITVWAAFVLTTLSALGAMQDGDDYLED